MKISNRTDYALRVLFTLIDMDGATLAAVHAQPVVSRQEFLDDVLISGAGI